MSLFPYRRRRNQSLPHRIQTDFLMHWSVNQLKFIHFFFFLFFFNYSLTSIVCSIYSMFCVCFPYFKWNKALFVFLCRSMALKFHANIQPSQREINCLVFRSFNRYQITEHCYGEQHFDEISKQNISGNIMFFQLLVQIADMRKKKRAYNY